jgi:hypothetical protein
MKDEAATLAAPTKDAAIVAVRNAIIHGKLVLLANEKLFHDLTSSAQPSS